MLAPVLSRRMIQPRNANCRHSSHVEVISHQEARVPTRDTWSPPYAYSVPVFGDHSTRLGKRVDNRPIAKGSFPKGTFFRSALNRSALKWPNSPLIMADAAEPVKTVNIGWALIPSVLLLHRNFKSGAPLKRGSVDRRRISPKVAKPRKSVIVARPVDRFGAAYLNC